MRWTVVRKLLAALAIFGMLASGIGLASYVIFNSPDQQASAPVRTPPKPPPPPQSSSVRPRAIALPASQRMMSRAALPHGPLR